MLGSSLVDVEDVRMVLRWELMLRLLNVTTAGKDLSRRSKMLSLKSATNVLFVKRQ